MKRFCYFFISFALISSVAFAQKLSVVETVRITDKSQGEFYFPKATPDGSKIFFTTSNYNGLWYYDLASKKVVSFTSEQGAGYEYAFSNDSKSVIYRVNNFSKSGMRASQTLFQKNIQTSQKQTLETGRELSTPKVLASNKIAYTANSRVVLKNDGTSLKKTAKTQTVSDAVVYIEDQKIVLYSNGSKKVLAPLGTGNYIWPSISPDGTKLLFTLAGKGTYVSDLQGKVLLKLGYANAPKWSPDGKWITYMVDKDNGLNVTGSDIYAVSADGARKYQLTSTNDLYEMHPEWTNDGNGIVFHSDEGNIYLMKLRID